MSRREWGTQVVVAADLPPCPRCSLPSLLAVRVPHGWEGRHGQPVTGMREVVLCSHCHADDRLAGPLVTFFHVHETVGTDTLEEFAELVHRWTSGLMAPSVDPDRWDEEYTAWRRGELD